ncbi:hypothetical protein CEXT_317871 [Caerostris extrusa]|uniref:Uncharacterized protein n=1 Tax=Caerostris extrusa TaxID=172846 RepID=A0AAV4X2V9_CAEEX|nr:hypothetical protein CEXT_317871 [Caerostris extrusa]
MDEITSSTEITENKLNNSKEETILSKFEIGENFTSNSDIFINNTITPQETTDDYSVEEVLDGEDYLHLTMQTRLKEFNRVNLFGYFKPK